MAAKLVTIFGGGGFLGRHLVRLLARQGSAIRVAIRDPESALHLKPMGEVGQITPIQANIRDTGSVRAAVAGADAVVNLAGVLFERGAQTFDAVHRQGAETVAEAAQYAGAARLVHVSALGASAQSTSDYARSKAAGEAAVRGVFPAASILRPSVVFGPQDDFFNRFATMARYLPMLPLIGGGQTRFQPAYVGDVAAAMVACLTDRNAAGKTYELGGPTVYTFEELMKMVLHYTGRSRLLPSIPFGAAALQARVFELLPKPPLTPDQVEMLRYDTVASGDLPGLSDLGIQATAVEAILPTYMDAHRTGGRFSQSLAF